MRYRKLLPIILALCMSISLVSCSKNDTDTADTSSDAEINAIIAQDDITYKALSVGYYADYGLNPYTTENAQNQTIMGLIYEPLFELDTHFNAEACIADSIKCTVNTSSEDVEVEKTTDDGNGGTQIETVIQKKYSYTTSCTVTLKNNVKFSDGSALTANDVVYSAEQAAANDSVYKGNLSNMLSVKAVGNNKVRFMFNGSNVNIEQLLTFPIVENGTANKDYPKGTGAYILKLDDNNKPCKLQANKDWWQIGTQYAEEIYSTDEADGSVEDVKTTYRTINQTVKTIHIYDVTDSDELIYGMSSKNVSLVSSDMTSQDALTFTGSYDITDYSTSNLIYLGCNVTSGACKYVEVRKAIYTAINRKIIVSRMMAGHAEVAYMPASPKSNIYDTALADEWKYSVETAKANCKAADPQAEIKLLVCSDSSFKVGIAQEIAKELNASGLDVKVSEQEWSKYKKSLKSGKFDLYLGEVKLSENFDISELIKSNGTLNYGKYDDSKTEKLLQTFNSTSGSERKDAASKLYSALYESSPIIPLCFRSYSIISNKNYLLSFQPTQQNFFHNFWDWSINSDVVKIST